MEIPSLVVSELNLTRFVFLDDSLDVGRHRTGSRARASNREVPRPYREGPRHPSCPAMQYRRRTRSSSLIRLARSSAPNSISTSSFGCFQITLGEYNTRWIRPIPCGRTTLPRTNDPLELDRCQDSCGSRPTDQTFGPLNCFWVFDGLSQWNSYLSLTLEDIAFIAFGCSYHRINPTL